MGVPAHPGAALAIPTTPDDAPRCSVCILQVPRFRLRRPSVNASRAPTYVDLVAILVVVDSGHVTERSTFLERVTMRPDSAQAKSGRNVCDPE